MKKAKPAEKAKRNWGKEAVVFHKKFGGKIAVVPVVPIRSRDDLSVMYTPGVAEVSTLLAKNPKKIRDLTMKGRTVAVVSDGSAVLGLGNVGPQAALPVMEGKAAIFKAFGGLDAIPIVLSTQNADEIVETVVRIAPGFGGINLEDIAAPKCFDIERRLIERLDIPVMHDDQHGTAIVVVAGLLNALKVVSKRLGDVRIVIVGAGAAGAAITRLLLAAGAHTILLLDSKGILHRSRPDLSEYKRELAALTNGKGEQGGIEQAVVGADVLIGVSGPNIVKAEHVALMAPKAIVFAMANPIPEIMPEDAKKGGAVVIATGRSDFPNQVNNSLAFPGVFKGALAHGVTRITDTMKLKAAKSIAALVAHPTAHKIVPDMFDKRVALAVAKVIR